MSQNTLSNSAPERPHILVVDDDQQIREMLCEYLSDEGYDVAAASDGLLALSRMAENAASLVITDVIMPNQDGVKTIQALKQQFPETMIIAMSGGGRMNPETFLPMARKFGADKTFEKPFNLEDMLRAVNELLRGTAAAA